MSTNNVRDIADFLKQKLENQQINPPENVWIEIQNKIPNYPTKFLGQWFWYSSVIIAIGISLAIYFSTHHPKTITKAKSVDVIKIFIPERAVVQQFVELNRAKPQNNFVTRATSQKVQSPRLENSTMLLEASVYSTIEKVEFIDSTNTIRKVFLNPSANEFGFYVLDISSLKKGQYQIIIYSNNGKTYQRVENFR
ncbi:MAG: hypothetical protein ACUVQP_10140 [Bacteroidales bacterium]